MQDLQAAIAFVRALAPVCRELGVTRLRVDGVEIDVAVSDTWVARNEPPSAHPERVEHEPPADTTTPPELAAFGIVAVRP